MGSREFAQYLRKARIQAGYSTQKELALAAAVDPATISNWEKGKAGRCNTDKLARVAKALSVPYEKLLELTGQLPSTLMEDIAPYSAVPGADPIDTSAVKSIPVLGRISAGNPLYSEQNIESMVEVPVSRVLHGANYFFLRVKGDSMSGIHIHDGDLILVREQPEVENGDIAVVMVNGGDEATVKRFYRSDGQVALRPENPAYDLQFYDPSEVRVIGRVVRAERDY